MAKSIKYGNEIYLDTKGIVHNKKSLYEIMDELQIKTETWTPTLGTLDETNPDVTYKYRRGRYYKIGKLVFISFLLRGSITKLNGEKNLATIQGLPFATIAGDGENTISIGQLYNAVTSATNLNFFVLKDVIRIQAGYGSSAVAWKVTPSGGYFIVAGSGFYETN